jgi:dipeptide/tripeptide permease
MIMAWGFVFAVAAALVMLLLRRDFEHQSESPPKKANPLSVLRDVVGNRTFWRLLVLMAFLALVKMMFQHMHFTWPKYVTREQGDGFPIGTLWSLNSLLILGLAPLGTALTRNRRPYDVMLLGACVSALSPLVLVFGSAMVFQIVTILVLTVGEALWSPRSYEYTVSIAPRGLESTYVALSSLPYFLAKFFVGPSSGYLLAAYCPAEGARHSSTLWAIIAASTILGPVGMLLSRGWMRKQEAAA